MGYTVALRCNIIPKANAINDIRSDKWNVQYPFFWKGKKINEKNKDGALIFFYIYFTRKCTCCYTSAKEFLYHF